MFKLNKVLERFKHPPVVNGSNAENKDHDAIKHVRNWYEERSENITVQRNLLFVLLLVLLCLSIASLGVVAYVVNAKRFDPFVIQIDDTTGMAKVVNPINSSVLMGNDSLAHYFIKKYVISRETYNPVDFETEAMKTVRLLSSSSIYWALLDKSVLV